MDLILSKSCRKSDKFTGIPAPWATVDAECCGVVGKGVFVFVGVVLRAGSSLSANYKMS